MPSTVTKRRAPKRKAAAPPDYIIATAQGDIDARELVKDMIKLPVLRAAFAHGPRMRMPKLTVRRRSDDSYSGRAWAGDRVVLSCGQGLDREILEMIALHELTHYVLPSKTNHGPLFITTYRKAAREWWPGIRLDEFPGRVYQYSASDQEKNVYGTEGRGLDGLIIARGREERLAKEQA